MPTTLSHSSVIECTCVDACVSVCECVLSSGIVSTFLKDTFIHSKDKVIEGMKEETEEERMRNGKEREGEK